MKLSAARRARELRGMTQPELAEAADVSLKTIVNVEGQHSVRPTTARKLARALDVSVAVLAGVEQFPVSRRDSGPETPALELALLYDASSGVRRRAVVTASAEEVARYLRDLDRALEAAKRAKPDEKDTADTRRLLVEHAERLGRMKTEAEVFGGATHAGVGAQSA